MKKISLILFVLTIFISLTSFISAHVGDDNFAHHSMMGYGFGFMWLFGWIFMILVVVALVLLIVWLIKQIQRPQRKRR
ncbi:MAG TPA: hypothetical protein ENH99_02085 [Candidatus Pacearchaeota archaeon]|nr:hypothetical protein [Candidatus Pacearchaeota archaeon]